jgi:hypothetical protein
VALLAPQKAAPAGSGAIVYAAAAGGGDSFVAGDNIVLRVKAGATPVTVTVASQRACDQGGTHNGGGVVAANTEQAFGPFPGNRWADTAGLVQVTYNQVVTITVAVESR